MTRKFDAAARQNPDLFELLEHDISLDRLEVSRVSVKTIRRAIVTGHYSERFGGKTLTEIRNELGWNPVVSHQKHRYAIGVGPARRRINASLDEISEPYPKPMQRLAHLVGEVEGR